MSFTGFPEETNPGIQVQGAVPRKGVPTFGEEGGVELVGTKYQVFPKIRLEGFPYLFEKLKGA